MLLDMKTTMPIAYAIVLICLSATTEAGVVFTRSGDSLVMTIDKDLVFRSIVSWTDTGYFGVSFENVYSVARPSNTHRLVDFSNPPIVVIDGVSNASSSLFDGHDDGDITLRDLQFNLRHYPIPVTITPGELITVPAGQYIAPGELSATLLPELPDLPVTTAHFWRSGGVRASASIAVPEPSCTALVAAMCIVEWLSVIGDCGEQSHEPNPSERSESSMKPASLALIPASDAIRYASPASSTCASERSDPSSGTATHSNRNTAYFFFPLRKTRDVSPTRCSRVSTVSIPSARRLLT